MMIKGGIRIGGLSKIGGFDADAAAYFDRAGVTDATAKSQINAFVIGVKDLGLYNNMVSWLLRSNQNSGTSAAYSLGGLITTNGTLTNGPTWGTDGITFDGVNDYISIPFSSKSIYSNFNFGGIFMASANDGTRISIQSNTPWIGVFGGSIIGANDTGSSASFGSYSLNSYLSANYDKNGTTNTIYRDGSSQGTFTSSVGLDTNPIYIGAYAPNAYYWSGKISIGYLFSQSLTTTQNANFYTLYKTTLGTGLGLP
jgi:hypothetical protein